MTYREALAELLKRSGMKQDLFADKIGYSRGQVNRILNGSEPGSIKVVEQCLNRVFKMELEDALCLPPDPRTAKEEEKGLAMIQAALRRGGPDRQRVEDLIFVLAGEKRRRKTGTDDAPG